MATQTDVPEGRGKAEAMRTFLARGGGVGRVSGRYRKGPMKDKTVQEAQSMFEDKWATVGDGIKDKYARRANNVLAPSEKKAQGLVPPVPRPMSAPEQQKSRMASYGFEKDAKGNAVPIGSTRPPVAPPAQGSTFAELTKAPVAPAGGPQSVGDGSSAATGWKPLVTTTPTFSPSSLTGKSRAEQAAALMDDAKANPPPPARRPSTAQHVGQVGRGVKANAQAAAQRQANSRMPTKPDLSAGGNGMPGAGSMISIGNSIERAANVRDFTNGEKPFSLVGAATNVPTKPVRFEQTGPPAPISAPSPAPAGQTPLPAANPANPQSVAPIPSPKPPIAAPEMVGPPAPIRRLTTDKPRPINSTTGLPMGYRPGDDVPDAQKGFAAQSVRDQEQAARPPIAPPKAKLAPATARYAQAQADYQKELDPNKAKEMDKVYAGSSSLDQAKIAAQSMKRAADPTLGAPKANVVTTGAPRARVVPPIRRPILAR